MIIIRSILSGLFKAILCFLGAWFSMYIGAAFCLALGLEPDMVGTKIVFWTMTIVQILYLVAMYVLCIELWGRKKR